MQEVYSILPDFFYFPSSTYICKGFFRNNNNLKKEENIMSFLGTAATICGGFITSQLTGITVSCLQGLHSEMHDYVSGSREIRYDLDYPDHKDDGYLMRVARTIFCKPNPVEIKEEDSNV